MREINKLVVHCSATPPDMDIGADEIRDWHIEGNQWSDIGYHYVIRRNGLLDLGREMNTKGAHVRGHNHDSIGICLVGGVDSGMKPDSNFTRQQFHTLKRLLNFLVEYFPNSQIMGHRDLDPGKDCPCFDVKSWWHSGGD